MDTFMTCPRKYWAEKVAKVVPFVESPQMAYGKKVHKHFEDRLLEGIKLPMDLTHHEPVMARLADAPGEGFPEQQLALDRDFRPCGWYDKNCHIRGIIDYVKVNGHTAIILDHKTGKRKDGFDQVDLMFAILSVFMPEIKTAKAGYYWTQGQKIDVKEYHREDVPAIWADYMPKVNKMQEAFNKDTWECQPNGLCRSWCGYKECQYSGQ